MRKLCCIALLLVSLNLKSQVKFRTISLDSALKESAATGKVIFAQFISESCDECNDVASRALNEPELGKVVNERCISLEIGPDYPDRRVFIKKYNPQETIGTFFLSG